MQTSVEAKPLISIASVSLESSSNNESITSFEGRRKCRFHDQKPRLLVFICSTILAFTLLPHLLTNLSHHCRSTAAGARLNRPLHLTTLYSVPSYTINGSFSFPAAAFASVFHSSLGPAHINATVTLSTTADVAIVTYSIVSDNELAAKATHVSAEIFDNNLIVQTTTLSETTHAIVTVFLNIALPRVISDFDFTGNMASLVYAGPNVRDTFSVHDLKVGSVAIKTALESQRFFVNVNVGSVDFHAPVSTAQVSVLTASGSIEVWDTLEARDTIVLNTSAGSINVVAAIIGGFRELVVGSRAGSVKLGSVQPNTEAVEIKISVSAGSVDAQFFGFKGVYSASVVIGSVEVLGKDVHPSGRGTGWVGDANGEGIIKASSSVGSIILLFE
ncbi:hypothetical protein HK100_003982 [Physocladia obscura]|uniref:Adhesin domain-containing protein n=1 Tax=Physocladia obscura TaxID=109957 RepID=A0AAD5T8Z9_9FUNG|nr:hypothetical protein HK100_003982 [Physocladia obscura]